MKKILLTFLILIFTISQTNAWLGLIAENWDLLNIAKWNQLVNDKLSRSDLKAWTWVTLTNSWSEIYINWEVSANWVPYIVSSSMTIFAKNDSQHVVITWRNFTPETTISTPAWTISNLQINSPIELEFDIDTIWTTWDYDVILENDWVDNSYWPWNWVKLFHIVAAYHSCLEAYNDWNTSDWNYNLIWDDWTYEAYCDMTTDWWGWTRVVRTNSDNQEWGQKNENYTYAANTDDTWIYNAYRYVKSFNKVMLKHIDSWDWASYDLVENITNDSIYDLMDYCKNQPEKHSDDNAWDWARVKWMTSDYSWTKSAWNMANVDYFFMCWVNEESDNDQSYLTFARASWQQWNWYWDSWRRCTQTKTTWALLNWDYYTSSNTHIWTGYGQCSAWKKDDWASWYYEVYIK